MRDSELTLFCAVWGEHYQHLFRDFALPSLMFPGNLPSCELEKIYVDILAPGDQYQAAAEIAEKELDGLPLEFRHVNEGLHNVGDGLTNAMHAARSRSTRMLLAPPDTIFAPKSIGNIWRYAKGKNVVVAGLYIRNNEDVFKQNFPLWKHWPQHRDYVYHSFSIGALDICDTHEDNCTHVGGVAWTKVDDETRLCLHYLPSPYLAWFTEDDEAWWKNNRNFGNWDHVWPSELMAQRRWRVIGSTDVFFAVELENAKRSVAMKPSPGTKGNELYSQRRPHNDAGGSMLIEIHG